MRNTLPPLTQPLNLLLFALALVPIGLVIAFQGEYAANFPRGDQFRTVRNAVAAHDGTLTLADLFEPEDGHIQFFTRLQTALVTWTTGWNLNVEMRINLVLAVGVWLLLLALFARTMPGGVALAAVPFSLLVFSLNQDFMWVVGFSSCWFYTNAFLLIALNAVSYAPQRPLSFIAALLGATAATFSFGNGLLAWGIIGLALPFIGFRDWRYYSVWVVVGAAVIAIFLTLTGISDGGESPATTFTLSPQAIQTALTFALTFVGGVFTTDQVNEAVRATLLGVAFAVVNIGVLVWRGGWTAEIRRAIGIWVALALFPAASGFLAGFSRPNWYQEGAETALQTQYKTGAVLFWVALVAVMITAATRTRDGVARRLLTAANSLFGAWLLLAFVLANYGSVAAGWHWSHRIKQQTEDCYVRYFFTQTLDENDNCWGMQYVSDLAPRELALFANYPRRAILPGYTDGTPVFVYGAGDAPRHISDWLLTNVPPDDRYYSLPLPPVRDRLWAVGWTEAQNPYTPTDDLIPVTLNHELPAGTAFNLTLYERPPDADTPTALFENGITLPLTARIDGIPAACEPLTVRTYWSATAPTAIPYSLTLTILQADGETVARADGQLSLVESSLWEAGRTYVDSRVLTLPCDLPTGEYQLAAGVYDWRDGARLAVMLPDADAPADFAILDRLTIEE